MLMGYYFDPTKLDAIGYDLLDVVGPLADDRVLKYPIRSVQLWKEH